MTSTPEKTPSPADLAAASLEVTRYIRFLAELGCRGFDCSPKSQATIAGWDRPRTVKPPVQVPVAGPDAPPSTLETIRRDLGACRRCALGVHGRPPVFGQGPDRVRLMLIGDVPDADDDAKGQPFAGESGDLLTRMIEAMGLSRESVYLTTLVKCCPPAGRKVQPEEIRACRPMIEAQIQALNPELICTLGAVATQGLLGDPGNVARMRGQLLSYKGRPLLPTFHPAYLLKHPESKREAWEDLKKIMEKLGLKRR